MIHSLLLSLIRLRALLTKEFLLLLRDPRMRFFVIVPPIIQLFVFAYAASFDVKNADVGVVDSSHSAFTRALLSSTTATGHFNLTYFPTMQAASTAVDKNHIRAIIHIANDFDRNPVIQLIADGSDSNSAQLVVGQLSQALRASYTQIKQIILIKVAVDIPRIRHYS